MESWTLGHFWEVSGMSCVLKAVVGKFHRYKIRSITFNFIYMSYLQRSQQLVCYISAVSIPENIYWAVPQSSVVGQRLLTPYMNDIISIANQAKCILCLSQYLRLSISFVHLLFVHHRRHQQSRQRSIGRDRRRSVAYSCRIHQQWLTISARNGAAAAHEL